MADSTVFPGWSGAGGTADAAWRQVVLGDVFLPGVCTINGLQCGIDVDTKKGKGHDRPHSTDNGVDASKFSIEVWLTERDWDAWLAVVDKINPRVVRQRAPFEIIHPEPNSLGITHVRVVSLTGTAPTARGGKKYRIDVVEWFDAPPVAVNKGKADKAKDAQAPRVPSIITNSLPTGLGETPQTLDSRLKNWKPDEPPAPATPENIRDNLYALNNDQ